MVTFLTTVWFFKCIKFWTNSFHLDHHEDSNDFKDVIKELQSVGSCATLITQKIHQLDDNILKHYPSLCEMLLCTILIDTYNLDLQCGRTTNQDATIAKILSSYTSIDSNRMFLKIQKGNYCF